MNNKTFPQDIENLIRSYLMPDPRRINYFSRFLPRMIECRADHIHNPGSWEYLHKEHQYASALRWLLRYPNFSIIHVPKIKDDGWSIDLYELHGEDHISLSKLVFGGRYPRCAPNNISLAPSLHNERI